jgi:hypothetical protein
VQRRQWISRQRASGSELNTSKSKAVHHSFSLIGADRHTVDVAEIALRMISEMSNLGVVCDCSLICNGYTSVMTKASSYHLGAFWHAVH